MRHDILDFEKVVPKALISFYVDKMELEADRRSFENMYNAINESDSELVEMLYNNYSCAGKTAVNIFQEVTLPAGFLTKEKMVRILQKEIGSSSIFNREFKPPLSDEPQINYVEDRGDSILIQFVAKDKPRRIRNGYDIMEVVSVNFEFAIVRFMGPTIIELRCAYNKHNRFLACFENYFREELKEVGREFEWIPITKVTNAEAEEIAKRLSAGLVEADHKDEGIYDRHIVTASPDVKNLREQEEYIQQFKNKMLLSQSLIISAKEETTFGEYETEVKFKINLHTGFQFLSKVSEAVIDYVMNVFIDVRYNEGGIKEEVVGQDAVLSETQAI
ncbi:hypothetical protein SB773_27010 [Bacillus sp. SIMBA_074]|uniref:hypothetical protein n=1 Tax=Bacillus sp. SIMBA_074 TaxID=3085812 RepID=UPI00397A27E9